MKINSYPKVYAMGHIETKDIFSGPVLVEEKVDGSQFSFMRVGSIIYARSKNADQSYPTDMFCRAMDSVQELDLHEGWIYRGEFLSKQKHNTLEYERVPEKHIVLYDIEVADQSFLSYDEVKKEAERLGIEVVPKFFEGETTLDELKKFIGKESVLGGNIEGFVIKNYRQFGADKKIIIGKYVDEKFKEKNSETWKKDKRKDIIERIALQYKTEARWLKAIQHLRDDGRLTHSPKDIGDLIKEIREDWELECEFDVSEQLFNTFKTDIFKTIIQGFPEFYKQYLEELIGSSKK